MTAALMLLAVLLLVGILLSILTSIFLALSILQPPRMNDGKAMFRLHRLSPGDLGLRFENEPFRVRDRKTGRTLHSAGWWIPHPDADGRCVVLVHGYADAKVGAIAWAPLFHKLGWNILAIDLRAHGESDGRYCTGGYFERDDLTQVLDELLTTRPGETRQLILFGVSLGAAVVAAVAAAREDLGGVILESPFTDYRQVVAAHFNLLGLPTGPVLRLAIWLAEVFSGAKFDEVRPIDTIPRIHCPVLAILGGDDELLSAGDVAALERSMGQHKLLVVEGSPHLMAMQVDASGYANQVSTFLDEAIASRR
jgi:pimeloyl-ACP methyl ester carboxylesterase